LTNKERYEQIEEAQELGFISLNEWEFAFINDMHFKYINNVLENITWK